MQVWLVCFDISDDRRRRRVGKFLQAVGLRVQRSVFEVSLRSPTQLTALISQLREQLDDTDDLRFYRLCKQCQHRSINVQNGPIADFPLAIVL